MDRVSVSSITWRGMPAWQITGAGLEVVFTVTGGHLAALRAPGDDLNPMWQPPWPACEPEKAASQADFYGEGEGTLLCTIVGLNLCIDRFGAPWPGEDKPVHGEAGVAQWSADDPDPRQITLRCSLPESKLRIARILELDGDTLKVTTEVSRIDGAEAEIDWAEHLTVGDPFLENAVITAGVDAAWASDMDDPSGWRWGEVQLGDPVDVDLALSMPEPASEPAGDIATCRVADGWLRVERPDMNKCLEARWNRDEFPWLCIWTQHRARTGSPWNSRTRAKGLEFSTKPFPEGKPPESRAREFHGLPTTCTIRAGQTLSRSMSLRWGATR